MHENSSFKFSIITFQKIYIISVLQSKFKIILHKQFVILLLNFGGFHTFINREVPRMLALPASVYQPDIDPVSVCIHTKLAGIDEFLLFTASAATVIHLIRRHGYDAGRSCCFVFLTILWMLLTDRAYSSASLFVEIPF